jgi:ABC-2 type transport system permease protein
VTVPATAPADRGAADDVALGRVFARTCAAEWTRLWTVRATWWFLAAATVVIVGIGAVAGLDAAGDPAPPRGDPAWAIAAVATMPGQFALLTMIVVAVTSDYATGGIVPTLQWTPRRGVLFLARTLVAVLAATVLGVLLGAGSAVAAYVAARPGLTLPWDEGLDVLATVALVVAAGTALAAGIGFLFRNTAGALVTVLLLMLVLPVLLPQFGYAWLSAVAEVLPGSGAAFLLLGEVPGMTQASSVTALLGWAGGALLLGWVRLVRDDANR